MSQICHLYVPAEIITYMAHFSDGQTVLKMIRVCKFFLEALTNHHILWKSLAEREFGIFVYSHESAFQTYKIQSYVIQTCKEIETPFFAFTLWSPLLKEACRQLPFRCKKVFESSKKFQKLGSSLTFFPFDYLKKNSVESDSLAVYYYDNFINGDQRAPSKVDDGYWIHAPIPSKIYPRFCHITRYSGMLVIYTPVRVIDQLWENFKIAYESGKLGYLLRASTSQQSKYSRFSQRVITIHVENCLNLSEVGRVAWEINQLLGDWSGSLQCIPDLFGYFKYKKVFQEFGKNNLFSIPSSFFRNKTIIKSKQNFINNLIKKKLQDLITSQRKLDFLHSIIH